jgi:hypothetical protein
MCHGSVPKATDWENLAIIILRRKFSEEFQYTSSALTWIPFLHDTKKASWIRTVGGYFIHFQTVNYSEFINCKVNSSLNMVIHTNTLKNAYLTIKLPH